MLLDQFDLHLPRLGEGAAHFERRGPAAIETVRRRDVRHDDERAGAPGAQPLLHGGLEIGNDESGLDVLPVDHAVHPAQPRRAGQGRSLCLFGWRSRCRARLRAGPQAGPEQSARRSSRMRRKSPRQCARAPGRSKRLRAIRAQPALRARRRLPFRPPVRMNRDRAVRPDPAQGAAAAFSVRRALLQATLWRFRSGSIAFSAPCKAFAAPRDK